ncbi:hypothetical protein [Providencia alcalifaciens]|uniref:hypothetical protein n=1 Tax=Providencia alcalifaciens TaxID=126385 RepID=UPI001CC63D60|nr:hypothetical protein [Providencia alcalifaciens]CAG9423408.1 hypothetical protein NVI2019_GHJFPKLH_02277 [Providencia alcalifaciens]
MILPQRVNIKFEQIKLTNHFKNTAENEFSRNIIGIKNMQEAEKGVCYGLTHAFLFYAHANDEKTYIKNLARALKKIHSIKENTRHYRTFLNDAFCQIIYKQALIDYALHIDYVMKKFDFSNDSSELKQKNTLNSINEIFFKNSALLLDNIREDDAINFKRALHQLYSYTYSTSESTREDILKGKSRFECHLIKLTAREIKKKCSNFTLTDLSLKDMKPFFELVKNHQKKIVKHQIIQKNSQYNIKYDTYTIIDNNVKLNSQNYITLEQFKQRINNRLQQQKDTICDFITKNHAMGITIKHINDKVIFKFFEPNKGLYITENKKKFFNLIEKTMAQQACLVNTQHEKIIEINTSYADKLHQYPLSNKIKEPKFYKS